jgi:hypothetical protein
MAQIARNLTHAVDGFFTGKCFLIHDRDPLFTKEFLGILAYAERFVRTIKEDCLDRMILFGEQSLRNSV